MKWASIREPTHRFINSLQFRSTIVNTWPCNAFFWKRSTGYGYSCLNMFGWEWRLKFGTPSPYYVLVWYGTMQEKGFFCFTGMPQPWKWNQSVSFSKPFDVHDFSYSLITSTSKSFFSPSYDFPSIFDVVRPATSCILRRRLFVNWSSVSFDHGVHPTTTFDIIFSSTTSDISRLVVFIVGVLDFNLVRSLCLVPNCIRTLHCLLHHPSSLVHKIWIFSVLTFTIYVSWSIRMTASFISFLPAVPTSFAFSVNKHQVPRVRWSGCQKIFPKSSFTCHNQAMKCPSVFFMAKQLESRK